MFTVKTIDGIGWLTSHSSVMDFFWFPGISPVPGAQVAHFVIHIGANKLYSRCVRAFRHVCAVIWQITACAMKCVQQCDSPGYVYTHTYVSLGPASLPPGPGKSYRNARYVWGGQSGSSESMCYLQDNMGGGGSPPRQRPKEHPL